MVVCQNEEDYNFLLCMRAHGWSRHLTPSHRKQVEAEHGDIDSRFLFLHPGYNLRPLEVQGAMLSVQLTQLQAFNANRRKNYFAIKERLEQEGKVLFWGGGCIGILVKIPNKSCGVVIYRNFFL